jgi:hypothetical protein
MDKSFSECYQQNVCTPIAPCLNSVGLHPATNMQRRPLHPPGYSTYCMSSPFAFIALNIWSLPVAPLLFISSEPCNHHATYYPARTWIQHVLYVQPFRFHCTEHLVALRLRYSRVVCTLPNQQWGLDLVYVVVRADLAVQGLVVFSVPDAGCPLIPARRQVQKKVKQKSNSRRC